MFSARPTRLFVIKFLGLWGGTVDTKTNKHLTIEDKEQTEIRGRQQLNNSNGAAQVYHKERYLGTPDTSRSSAIEASRRKIQDSILEQGIPGLTISVSKRGQIVWQSGFGYCDVENQVVCEPDALMRIASISKSLFAATVIGPLIEEKKIDLNSSVHEYLSSEEFPKKTYNGKECDITIEQLLSHTSGIKHYSEGKPEDLRLKTIGSPGSKKIYQDDDQYNKVGFYQRKTFRSVIEALEPFKFEPLVGEPGKFNYTTYGYTLLSAVVEKIHQKEEKCEKEQIEDFWMKLLRKSWVMDNTHLDQDEVIMPKRARYYLRTSYGGGLINAPYSDTSVKWAGGGITSNTQNLVRFGQLLIDSYKERKNAILKKETIDHLWKERKESYALGFIVLREDRFKNEKLIVFHDGGALGASSTLIIYPDSEIVVAILTNLGSISVRSLGMFIADEFEKLD